MSLRTVLLFSALSLAAACDEPALTVEAAIQRDYIGPERVPPKLHEAEQASRECEAQLRAILRKPAAPGAPGFDANRVAILSYAKAEPVLFVDTPRYSTEPAGLELSGYRRLLESGASPWATVERVLAASAGRYQLARDALLKDGYLYAENPQLAFALVGLVGPHHLFGHDRIWISRGDRTYSAERRNDRYYYVDGPLAGERVRLLHLDRIGAESPPPPPLHRDLRTLSYEAGFERMEIRHVTHEHIVANLRYGKWWVPSVLRAEGEKTKLECEVLAPALRPEVEAARRANLRRNRVVQSLQKTILDQVAEGLPFDEPYHEYGHQLDGKLRSNWHNAYLQRRPWYAFNGDQYYVFDPRGRPLVPQVCVDFLTDTLERASGTWWAPRGEPPGRLLGKLDFNAVEGVDRAELRQVPKFVQFAKAHPEWFDVRDAPASELTVTLGKRDAFYEHLRSKVEDYAPGDIVLIKGKTPWDPRRAHYHSFFVYERDPVTGVPIVVAGNAGKPSLRAWETEARRTPDRSIHHRIRPRTEWLESVLVEQPSAEPFTLVTARD